LTTRRRVASPPPGAPANTFLGLSGALCDPARARYVVLPVPYERGSARQGGAREGPQALLRASHHLERFDEEVWGEPCAAGIFTAPPFRSAEPPEAFMKGLAAAAGAHVSRRRFVVTLGGERTLAEGPVAACAGAFADLSVLRFSAGADLRAEAEASRRSTATRLARHARVVQVAVRQLSQEESRRLNRGRVKTFLGRGGGDAVVEALTEAVYVSFSLDALDPSVAPGVAEPVPGGWGWDEALGLIRTVAERRRLVGADVTELSPLPDEGVSEFTAARLVYKIIAYHWRGEHPK
jgi:agmatinase